MRFVSVALDVIKRNGLAPDKADDKCMGEIFSYFHLEYSDLECSGHMSDGNGRLGSAYSVWSFSERSLVNDIAVFRDVEAATV